MTVKELIALLEKCDPDAQVLAGVNEYSGYDVPFVSHDHHGHVLVEGEG